MAFETIADGVSATVLDGRRRLATVFPMSTITGFHHVAVQASDFDRTIGFYTTTLGLATKATWTTKSGRAALVEVSPGSYVEVFERQPVPSTGKPPILHFCLRTDDVDGMVARVRAEGYPVTVEPTDVELDTSIGPMTLRLAFVDGPDGVEIEFMTSEV